MPDPLPSEMSPNAHGLLARLGPLGRAVSTYLALPGRRCLIGASTRLWLWNILASCLLHLSYTDNVNTSGSAKVVLFLYMGLISNAFIISFLPALLSLLASLLVPRKALRLATGILATIWTLMLVAILIDTEIWGIFRYHFNGMVWATITNPGAGDAVHLGLSDKLTTAAEIIVIFIAEWLLFKRLMGRATSGFWPPSKRLILWILLPILLVEKTIYAHADLMLDRRVTALARVFPLYQRFTIKRVARKHFGFDLEARTTVDLGGEGILLDYPLSKPVFAPRAEEAGTRPNIVVIVIDSVREDMLAPDTMPNLTEFIANEANGARVFEDHFSGGNATRFGLFSIIYSLHGSYWIPVYTEGTSPVLVDSLLELGYETQVIATASMNYPELRPTAWTHIQDRINDHLGDTAELGRDGALGIAFEDWLGQLEDEGKDDTPFFAFTVLDAPHQTYDFPPARPDQTYFEPYMESVDYKQLSKGASDEEKALLINRYKNAVIHADDITGDMIESLRRHGELENTIVIITSDHGEEFWENGFWGHTSNFTKEQAHVPFVMAGPGVAPGIESRATAHVDLVPTLLELLGADPSNREDWSVGENLFDLPGWIGESNDPTNPDGYRRRVVSGWDLLGLDTPGGILVIPTETHRGLVEPRDHDWQIQLDDDLIKIEAAALSMVALQCRRFLR